MIKPTLLFTCRQNCYKNMTDQNASPAAPIDKEDKWGYDLYPERKGT